jgi:predicted transcriptional regulator
MRTTLTLDEDVARHLKMIARSTDRSFKEVVNEAIRRGLSLGDRPPAELPPFVVEAEARGFKTGIDPTKLNQLYDDLEMEASRRIGDLEVHES